MKTRLRFFVSALISLVFLAPQVADAKVQPASEGNDYPIVLVHGLTGWGRDEMGGFKYWGGLNDIEANLNSKGHKTYTAAVGPVSSNWDRAVELYHYIKGGTVDYGAAHAKEHGHDRFGRSYPGIYSQWDSTNKIHLVGHSMGGQTSRTLVELLKNGNHKEKQYFSQHPEEGLSPLFKGGKSWAHSVTSIATPHNGSTFADEGNLLPLVKQMVLNAGALSGANSETMAYDFKLDQWGLKRKRDENFVQYADRVYKSSIWTSEDISLNDLTTFGAAKVNEWVKAQPNVYYFSYTGNATFKVPLTGYSYPIATMNPLFIGSSGYMGSYTRSSPEPVIDKSWWPNDGLVNVVSSKYPFGQAEKPYDGNVKQGEWNHFPIQYGWDHMDYNGMNAGDAIGLTDIYRFYNGVAENLHQLPR
ncbi:triacylglycerol lipase [Bacillus sp. V59.32b]|uniref:esterase/lipase family protein n=1 Tax=Bacillus sp. V59.32b TaxID=1758642 RepID=UPI0020B153FB|nr:lipase [Bacillus sp. V59.32b]